MQGAYRKVWKGRRLQMAALMLGAIFTTAPAWGQPKTGLIGSLEDMAVHGYVDNFTILRNDTFKEDYHVASSRYRASIQLSGPLRIWQDIFNRFEYFIELRPEYESVYDITEWFGRGRNSDTIAVSGRGRFPRRNRALLEAFGLNPHKFAEIWPVANLLLPYSLVPGGSYGIPNRPQNTRKTAYVGLNQSQNDLRFGMLRDTNFDLYYPVREAYFDLFFDAFGGRNWLRLGKQQHVWGKADFFRLQDIVNPVNFSDHFFIDLFDDTRVPLWSALFEHRFGAVGPLKDVAGSIVWVFDRYTSLGFGHPAQPWAIGFGKTIDTFALGNDLFAEALFPGQGLNVALYDDRRPAWNLKNSGIGTRWEATVGNFRIQLTDWFAFQDTPAFGFPRMHFAEFPLIGPFALQPMACRQDVNGNSIFPEPGDEGGFDTTTITGLPVRVRVDPRRIRMSQAAAVADLRKLEQRRAAYIARCGFTGELIADYRKVNTLGLSLDWFEPRTGFVIRTEISWTANLLTSDLSKPDLFADTNVYRWVLGIDRPTLIRFLNPTRSFFLSFQAFGTHVPDARGGRFGIPLGANNNFIFTFFVQNQFMRDQLVYLLFGAYGTTGNDATLGGNAEYLITNNWSVQLGITAFLGERKEHSLGPFGGFTGDGRPVSETGFGIGHMQAGGSERNQMNEFWGRIRYRF
ncbi:MAG: DUF1302 family protein [Thermodesulfobacteriota bacterium]